ncbi:amino acid adenylation domain-containing protein [Streptomyces aculeolatus]
MSPADTRHEVTDRWPLVPLQAGMLVQSLRVEAADIDLVQHLFDLEGALDVPAFTAAWSRAARRHPVLRSAFSWGHGPEPEQRVFAGAAVPLSVRDWRGLSAEAERDRLAALLAADRRAGIRLDRPPPARLTLLRTGERAHRLLWTSHHGLLDGWSRTLVLREVMEQYGAVRAGVPDDQVRPGPRYGDFADWLRGQDEAAAKTVWQDALAGFAAPTRLRLAPPATGEGTGEVVRTLGRPQAAELTAFARANRLTAATVLHGALAVVLHRYSGSQDVLFGSTLSVRPPDLDGVEDMAGLLINTIPVRVRVRPAAEAAVWLREFQDRLLDLREHGHRPLTELQAHTDVPAGTALFDTLLVFENHPGAAEDSWAAAGVRMTFRRTTGRTGYPLTVTAEPGDGLKLVFEYERTVLDDAAAARIADSLEAALTAMAGAPPGLAVGGLPVIPEDRCAPPPVRARPAAPRPVHRTIGDLASARPEAIAVRTDDTSLTYGALWARAGALAARLRAAGAGPEAPVGVHVERSADLVVAALAVLRTGGACLLLDRALPERRIRFMLDDSGARAVVSHGEFAWHGPVLDVGANGSQVPDGTDGTYRTEVAYEPDGPVRPDELAYLVYTSGSTGTPKGVAVTHRSLATHCESIRAAYGLGPDDSVMQFASVAFDAAVEQILATLAAGAMLVLRGPDLWDPHELLDRLRRHRVTVMELTPEYWYQLVDAVAESPAPGLGRLRLMNVGGDAVAPEQLARWAAALPDTRTVNSYGPAEATITATFWPYDGSCPTPVAPIGRPLAHVDVHLLDAELRPVPVGVPGEICVGGRAVARGYPGRAALTAERFVPDPYAAEPGARMYRTGDIGRLLPDGSVEFLGRLDDQVQIRGIRVEPAETAAELRRHPSVTDAVVLPREGPGGERVLGAYVTPGSADPGALRAFLRESLPDAMVPAFIVPLDRMPLSAAGKLDRAALPLPEQAGTAAGGPAEATADAAAEGAAAGTELERQLAGIWARVLGRGHVGLHDDFFDLGGHSLTMLRVLALARQERVGGLTLRALFRHPTVARLAAALQDGRA